MSNAVLISSYPNPAIVCSELANVGIQDHVIHTVITVQDGCLSRILGNMILQPMLQVFKGIHVRRQCLLKATIPADMNEDRTPFLE